MWSSDTHLNRVCAAATDGRMSNVRFIQSQLKAFYESILASREGILEAIKSNPLITSTEAEVEFSLAIAAVKEHYDEINFDQAIADEYKVAKGEGNPSRRVGHGVVVLRPTTHTRFYAIVSAVACAIASGNTFIVECEKHAVDELLASVFQPLDWEIYALVDEPLIREDITVAALFIDQNGLTESRNCIRSLPEIPSIAVVDRTANVEKAAKEILSTQLAFTGQSPHAPDLIVVNEWVKKEFIEILTRERLAAHQPTPSAHTENPEWKSAMINAETRREIKLIEAGGLYIVDVLDRSSSLVTQRGRGRYLTLLTVTSLTDAVLALSKPSEYLIAYHFAEPAACKFLSQQINSHWSFINHVPLELLVGPALPLMQKSFSLGVRYTKEMMSRSRPEIMEPTNGYIFDLNDLSDPLSVKLQSLRRREMQPLRETGQGPGTAIGFFEQGIIVGALFIVLPVVSLVGYLGWMLARRLLLGTTGETFAI